MSTEYLASLEALPSAKAESKLAATGTAKVFLDQKTGPPQHLASGFIYGIPDRADQIPSHFYHDVGFRYTRAGGSQIPGNRGWANSEAHYEERFASALSNYRTARTYNGDFICLISDLWGADGGQPKDALWPGDNDDWTHFDALLTRWIADAKATQHVDGLIFDIWNEPDLTFFWDRSIERYLQLWSRTYQLLRKEFPSLRISGPSFSAAPSKDDKWWTAWLAHIATTNELPDQWAWHMESGDAAGTMSNSVESFRSLLLAHATLAPRADAAEININEYAIHSEQLPSGGAWWISQLERQNVLGLRGNWAMAGALHDFMAGLVGKPGAGTQQYQVEGKEYWLTAEGQVYKYYASEMKGDRVRTAPTEGKEELGDVYATSDGKVLRILAGSRARPGKWGVVVGGLSSKEVGSIMTVKTLVFRGDEKDHFKEFGPPEAVAEKNIQVEHGKIFLTVEHEDNATAFAFEVLLA